jgi:NADH:ubiquinone oxidoreductase subunit H
MAFPTIHLLVLSLQVKSRQGMIEITFPPIIGGVANRTIFVGEKLCVYFILMHIIMTIHAGFTNVSKYPLVGTLRNMTE